MKKSIATDAPLAAREASGQKCELATGRTTCVRVLTAGGAGPGPGLCARMVMDVTRLADSARVAVLRGSSARVPTEIRAAHALPAEDRGDGATGFDEFRHVAAGEKAAVGHALAQRCAPQIAAR